MPFEPGKSGNPAGRPKGSKEKSTSTLIRVALEEVCRENPGILAEAIERQLNSRNSMGMIELAAKLNKELVADDAAGSRIAIIFNSGLDPAKLKQVEAKVIEWPQESKELEQTSDSSLTTLQALPVASL